MRIGIIGAGAIGGTLARGLADLGHQVSIANSRGPETLKELAAETGATAVSVREAARAKDVVILGRIEALDTGTPDSQWVAERLGRPVVKAFNNIVAKSLREKGTPAGSPGRLALSVAGDPPEARAIAIRIIEDLGFDAIDAGGLDESWRQQPGTPAYCRDLDAASLTRATRRSRAQPAGGVPARTGGARGADLGQRPRVIARAYSARSALIGSTAVARRAGT
jgi:hypothetical protein